MEYVVNIKDIREALLSLGGKAPVAEIRHKILESHTKGETPTNYTSYDTFRATVQRKIEDHCPQAEDYDYSKDAIFKRVGHGVYEIIDSVKEIYAPNSDEKKLIPRKYKSTNKFIVSESRFKEDYVFLDTLDEVAAYANAGFKVRMSSDDDPTLYSLITPSKLTILGGPSSEEQIKKELSRLAKEPELDGASSTITRKEQALLRKVLVKGQNTATCAICGKKYPIDFLVAAHLKKRSRCSVKERLDIKNIAKLMCKLGCDDLYEKGYIYVQNGKVKKGKRNTLTPDLQTYIDAIENNPIEEWEESAKYFEWHRSTVATIQE